MTLGSVIIPTLLHAHDFLQNNWPLLSYNSPTICSTVRVTCDFLATCTYTWVCMAGGIFLLEHHIALYTYIKSASEFTYGLLIQRKVKRLEKHDLCTVRVANRTYSHKLLTTCINNYVNCPSNLYLPVRFLNFTRQILRKSLCESSQEEHHPGSTSDLLRLRIPTSTA